MTDDSTMLRIAVASSRRDTRWTNTAISWHDLKERCKPLRTRETLAEYQAMSKDERGNV